jgi:hypothetical protein
VGWGKRFVLRESKSVPEEWTGQNPRYEGVRLLEDLLASTAKASAWKQRPKGAEALESRGLYTAPSTSSGQALKGSSCTMTLEFFDIGWK